jgi:perosamine synthetase
MIPLAIPNISGNEGRYLQECVDTNFVSSVGPFVDRFEEAVASAAGAPFATATSAGTTGLHAALTAVGVGRDDLVILPSMTFIASANAIAHCGAMPWLVDISEDSWTLDVTQCGRLLDMETEMRAGEVVHTRTGRRVRAIMPVSTLGMPFDADPLKTLAQKCGLPIVADSAPALGGLYKRRPMGRLGADLSVFSFNGNKTVTAGGGGAVVGNDKSLCDLVRHLTTTARSGTEYDHDRIGFNYRMTNLQAAVGCAQLERLDEFVDAKRRIAARYTAELASLPGLAPFPNPAWAESACWFSGVVLEQAPRAEVVAALRERGVDARPFWKPVHLQAPFADAPTADLRVTEAVWPSILTLPCSTALSFDEQSQVIDSVTGCLAHHGRS